MSSVNHDDFAHLKIPLEIIQIATNNFAKKNFWGEDDFGKHYVGQLMWSGELIKIQVRRWLKEERDDEKEQQFWMEIFMLSTLKHKNLVSLVGFCDDNDELISVIKLETRGSLNNYLSDAMMLTWVRRLEISVSVAKALSYIHYDEYRDFSIIHQNIDSETILLNDNWEPKLSEFRLSMKIEASERRHSFHVDKVWDREGYTDTTYIKTNSVSQKSDIYSFGIVLFELLCGRRSIIDNQDNKYLAPLAITHYREKKLYDIIDPDIWKQMDPQSFNIFAEIAYDCLNEERSQRPNIDDILTRLENALRLQLERENVGSVSFISAGVESHVTKYIKRVDARYKKTGGVTHKSNVYSFRVVLSTAMNGRSAFLPDKKLGRGLLSQLEKSRLDRPFTIQVVKRSHMVSRLQSIYENRELPKNAVDSASSDHDKGSLTSKSTHVESHVSKKTKSFLKDLSHLKLSYQDIKSAINNFAVENIIEQSKLGTIYKGRLLNSEQFIDIIVKRFVTDYIKDDSKKIWTEIWMLSSLKHKNLVSLIGFCDEEHVKMIIYKKEANRSLETYLVDQTLTWMQRLKICVGVAKALSYIHYDPGRDFSVIHCNIRSSNILLDDKWEPKLSGFELSLKNTVARRNRLLLTHDVIEDVYLDPKYEKTWGVTHKSDVYSFGVVLFEVLCGRSADEGLGEGLLCQLVNSHLEDMVHPHLRKQMDQEALKIFSETAYCCIKEDRVDRPYIKQVVRQLEEALELQSMYENPKLQRNAVDNTSSSNQLRELPLNAVDGTSSSYNHLRRKMLQRKNLEHLKIGLDVIIEATKNFDDTYCIGSGGFGKVYKAYLEHFDGSNSSSIQGKNKCDLPKKRSTVAIKRIYNQYYGEEGFIAEIEILTRCKHENIISLLGFCDDGPDRMILVYELASKGSLEGYLGSSDKRTILTWVQRVKICLDIAHGLNYIHNNTEHGKQMIIHRDIKSDNILFGDNWEAKITDFGLSKFYVADQDTDTLNIDEIADLGLYKLPGKSRGQHYLYR